MLGVGLSSPCQPPYPLCPLPVLWEGIGNSLPASSQRNLLVKSSGNHPRNKVPCHAVLLSTGSHSAHSALWGQRSCLTHELTEAQTGHSAPHPSTTDWERQVPNQVCTPENSSTGIRPPAVPTQGSRCFRQIPARWGGSDRHSQGTSFNRERLGHLCAFSRPSLCSTSRPFPPTL